MDLRLWCKDGLPKSSLLNRLLLLLRALTQTSEPAEETISCLLLDILLLILLIRTLTKDTASTT